MSRRQRSAKALVFNPLFRSRQEQAKKGKGCYNRKPRNPQQDSGLSFWGLSFGSYILNCLT
jgi:stalled ribosome alternative rescue factor ArfA